MLAEKHKKGSPNSISELVSLGDPLPNRGDLVRALRGGAGRQAGIPSAAFASFGEIISAGFILLATFLIRPAHLGEDFTPVGVCVAIFGALAAVVLVPRRAHGPRIGTTTAAIYLLWAFLVLHSEILGNTNGFHIRAFVGVVGPVVAYSVSFSRGRVAELFLMGLFGGILLVCGSAIITEITFVLGHPILLGGMPTSEYPNSGWVYFPFTMCYGLERTEFIGLPRFIGLWREPGIAQVFINWGIIRALVSLKGVRLFTALSVLYFGVVATQSTIGYAVLAASTICGVLLRKKTSIPRYIVLLGLGVLLIGLSYHVYKHTGANWQIKSESASFKDRELATDIGLELLLAHPFGVGLYNVNVALSTVNAFALSGQIGIIGLFLLAVVGLASIMSAPNKMAAFATLMPAAITFASSQPLLNCGAIYVFVLLAGRENAYRHGQMRVATWAVGSAPKSRVRI